MSGLITPQSTMRRAAEILRREARTIFESYTAHKGKRRYWPEGSEEVKAVYDDMLSVANSLTYYARNKPISRRSK